MQTQCKEIVCYCKDQGCLYQILGNSCLSRTIQTIKPVHLKHASYAGVSLSLKLACKVFGLLLTKSSHRFNSSKNILPTHIYWLSCDQTCYVRTTSVGASVEWIVKSKATMGLDLIPVWLSNIVWLKVTDYISKVRDVFWRWWDQYEGRIFKILLVHLMCLKLLNCLPQNLICCFSNNRQNLMWHVFLCVFWDFVWKMWVNGNL